MLLLPRMGRISSVSAFGLRERRQERMFGKSVTAFELFELQRRQVCKGRTPIFLVPEWITYVWPCSPSIGV